MYFYEEKTKQGYRFFQSLSSLKKIVNRIKQEPFPVEVVKSSITDEENGLYSVELTFYQYSPQDSLFSESVHFIIEDINFSDLRKYQEIIKKLSSKSLSEVNHQITTVTKQKEKMMEILEGFLDH